MKKKFLSGLLLATMLGSATSVWADKYTYTYICNDKIVAYYESEGENSDIINSNAIIWGTGNFAGHKYFLESLMAVGPNFRFNVKESNYSLTCIAEKFGDEEPIYESKILYDSKIIDRNELANIQDTVIFNIYRERNGELYRFQTSLSGAIFGDVIPRSYLANNKSDEYGNYRYEDLPKVLVKSDNEYDEDNDGILFSSVSNAIRDIISYSSTDENHVPYKNKILFYGEGEDTKYGGSRFVWNGYNFSGNRIKTSGNSFNIRYSGGYAGIIKNNGKYSLGKYPAGSYKIKIRKFYIPTSDKAERDNDFKDIGYPKDFQSSRNKPLYIYSSGSDVPLDGIVGNDKGKEYVCTINLKSPADLYLKGDNIPFDYVVVETNTEDVHVNDYGYATYSSSNALDFSRCASEVDVFKATLVNTSAKEQKETGFSKKVKFVNVTAQLIPANTGILVRSKSQKEITVKADIVDDYVSGFTDNFLMPVVNSEEIKPREERDRTTYRNFVLNKQNVEDKDGNVVSRVNFYRIPDRWSNQSMTCRAHSAYLSMPVDYTNGQAKSISISFDDEDVTGINNVFESDSTFGDADNDAMYNLAGQRVDRSYKGIVIRNGKKYLNK